MTAADATQGTTTLERKTGATRGTTDTDTDVDIEFVLIKLQRTGALAFATPPTDRS